MRRVRLFLISCVLLIMAFAFPAFADAPNAGETFYIANSASSKLLDVYGDTTKNKANVQVYEKTSGNNYTQQFVLTKTSGGWFSITPVSNETVAVNPFSDTPKSGTNVNVYTLDTADKSQGWYIEAVGSAYKICSAYNKNLVLTAEGTANKSNVKIATFSSGNKNQLWTFTNVNGSSTSDDPGKSKATETEADPKSGETSADESAGIKTGTYYNFINAASRKALDVAGNSSKSQKLANIQIYTKGNNTNYSQQFALVKNNKSGYNIYIRSNSKLAVNPYANKPKDKTNVNVYTLDKNDKTQGWIFEKAGNYYIIRSAYNKNLVLTATGSKNTSNVNIQTYKKDAKSQLWSLAAPVKPSGKYVNKKAPYVYPRRAGDNTGTGVTKVSKALKGVPVYNQTKYKGMLGNSSASISGYGCLACSYATVESYYQGKALDLKSFIKNKLTFNKSGYMQASAVTKKYTAKSRPTFTFIYNLINKGKPVICCFETNAYDSKDATYHYHWAVISAYKDVELDKDGKPVNLTAANFLIKDSGGIGGHAGTVHSLNDYYSRHKRGAYYSHIPYIRYR